MTQDPATKAPPKAPSKGDRTRARILDAAAELFSRSGFHAVSLRDIAAHAGLTHAGLLHHFPGKEDLLLKVLARRDKADAPLLFGADADAHPGDALDLLVGIVARNTHTPGLVGLYVKLSGEAADPDHPAHAYFVERYRVVRTRLAEILGALFQAQSPPLEHDPAAVAQQFVALMDGLQTQWLLEPDAVDMRGSVVLFLRALGLRPSEEPDRLAERIDPAPGSGRGRTG